MKTRWLTVVCVVLASSACSGPLPQDEGIAAVKLPLLSTPGSVARVRKIPVERSVAKAGLGRPAGGDPLLVVQQPQQSTGSGDEVCSKDPEVAATVQKEPPVSPDRRP